MYPGIYPHKEMVSGTFLWSSLMVPDTNFLTRPMSRKDRVDQHKKVILSLVDEKQKEFLEFVLQKYEEGGYMELNEEKLPILLNLKYHALSDAEKMLGDVDSIRSQFFAFQVGLYSK